MIHSVYIPRILVTLKALTFCFKISHRNFFKQKTIYQNRVKWRTNAQTRKPLTPEALGIVF